jgi:hypothetical protein
MNINSDYSNDNNGIPSPQDVMDQGMGFIFDKMISPMKDQLSTDDIAMLGIIGVSFKIIAEQAQAYENSIADQMGDSDESFYRN